jgi:hypothetical protein
MKASKTSSALSIQESKVMAEGQTGTNQGTPSIVDLMQELGAQDEEPAKDCSDIDRHDGINWSRYSRVVAPSVIVCALASNPKDR